jgi:hypothetical protein
LRADGHLFAICRRSGAGVDAGAATRLDHDRARSLEDLQISPFRAVLANVLRTELDVEADVRMNASAFGQSFSEYTGVHVHVGFLTGRARTAVGDVDLHLVR